jgi:RNA polymerase sigma factor (TIGR02999 family)
MNATHVMSPLSPYELRESQVRANATIENILDAQAHRLMCRSASSLLRREMVGHLMDETDIVHDAVLRIMCAHKTVKFNNQTHLLATTRVVMRRQLIDHARTRNAKKAHWGIRVCLEPDSVRTSEDPTLRLMLKESLDRLARYKSRLYCVIAGCFFEGLSEGQMADRLKISSRTVKRALKSGVEWLRNEMTGSPNLQNCHFVEMERSPQIRSGRAATRDVGHPIRRCRRVHRDG